jgi:hypothetical protein
MLNYRDKYPKTKGRFIDQNYANGFRDGYLDYILGRQSIIGLTSTIKNYASGYYDGQIVREEENYESLYI